MYDGSMKKEMGEYTFRAKLKMGKTLFFQTFLCQSFDIQKKNFDHFDIAMNKDLYSIL